MSPHAALLAFLLLASLVCVRGSAAAGLYETRAIVTGQGEENRAGGFATALAEVLAKVSGDPRLLGDPRVAALAGEAGTYVASFRYRDRLAGIPVRDEQGTRDRPYDLWVAFDDVRIDALLRSLGRDRWPLPRPRVGAVVAVDNGTTRYLLASDGERGRDQRDALTAAAEQLGVPLVLPIEAALAEAGLTPQALAAGDIDRLAQAVQRAGGDVPLAGDLVWNAQALGWTADWRLVSGAATAAWRIGGVSFDEAFRNAMRGTAQLLSGNGRPDP